MSQLAVRNSARPLTLVQGVCSWSRWKVYMAVLFIWLITLVFAFYKVGPQGRTRRRVSRKNKTRLNFNSRFSTRRPVMLNFESV